jgi:regulator of replication initiation timing
MSATIQQIEAKLKNGQNLHAWLMYNGAQKIARNVKQTSYPAQCNKILSFLSNPMSPDGIYQILCSPIYADKAPESITYIKGEITTTPVTMAADHKFLSNNLNDEATKLLARVEILEYINAQQEQELKSLIEENESLNAEIEELTEKLKQNTTLSEPAETPLQTAKTMFSEILQVGVPLLDKYFQIQEDKNNILRQQMRPSPNAYQAPEVKKEIGIQKKIERWINSKADDTETMNNLQAIYYNSSDIQKFGELLKDYNENLYNELRQEIYR